MRLAAIAAAAALSACSSAAQPVPLRCDPATQRYGTYSVHFDNRGGNCGSQPDTLIILSPMTYAAATVGCTLVYSQLSQAGCRVDFQQSCPASTSTGYTVQETQDGSVIRGEMSIAMQACFGTYALTYTRR